MAVYWRSAAGIITTSGSSLTTTLSVCKLAITWLGADPDSLTDVGTITSASTKEEVLCNVVVDSARKAVLEDRNWKFATRDVELNLAAGTDEAGYDAIAVSGATQADPVVISATSHGFQNGWHVRLYELGGMTEINGMVVRVSSKSDNTFECYQLDGTQFTAYTSGGYAIRYEINSDYQNGYIYEVPGDFLRPVATLPEGSQFEIIGSGNDRRLLSPESDLVLQYIADIDTVTDMPEHFKRAWAGRVAAELAAPLQKKGTGMRDMWEHYTFLLRENDANNAKNVDAKTMIRESSPTLTDGGWE